MLIGLLMLFVPPVIYLATYPVSKRFTPLLRNLYRIVGGIIVLGGSVTSYYFAAYTGDQGGIAAYFFQIAVIFTYVLFSATLVILNWLLCRKKRNKNTR
ncbi:MAG: hypothetical protein R3F53_07640 [Gammaproteobacteria bacterium]